MDKEVLYDRYHDHILEEGDFVEIFWIDYPKCKIYGTIKNIIFDLRYNNSQGEKYREKYFLVKISFENIMYDLIDDENNIIRSLDRDEINEQFHRSGIPYFYCESGFYGISPAKIGGAYSIGGPGFDFKKHFQITYCEVAAKIVDEKLLVELKTKLVFKKLCNHVGSMEGVDE